MTMSTAVKTCLSKYVTFSGRASRPEYWYFFLFILIVNFGAALIDQMLFGSPAPTAQTDDISPNSPLQSVVGLALFLPQLAVAWRRMHDSGRSGLYVLFPTILAILAALILLFGIGLADHFAGGTLDVLLTDLTLILLIPTALVLLISPLLVLWWLTRPSQPGPNSYGPNPYEVTP